MAERITSVDYVWKNEAVEGDNNATVVILNDSDKYEEMCADDTFDARIWFYFQDEAEFQRAFDPNSDEFEFTLIREEA